MTREREIEQLCAELAQLRTEDGAWDERCLYEFIKERAWLEALAETLRRQLKHAENRRDYWIKEYDEMQGKRDATKRQLAGMEAGRDFWRREYERNDKRQATVAEEAAIVETAEAYLAQRKRRHLVIDEDCKNLQDVLEHRSDAAAKLLERLATLDAAEKALADCKVAGIYVTFDSLADAITQLSGRVIELESEPIEVEITGQEMVEALQSERATRKMLARQCDMARTAETEAMKAKRQLAETEQRAERAEALAALVTEETAAMLERLAGVVAGQSYHRTADRACALAAQIREALDDKQA